MNFYLKGSSVFHSIKNEIFKTECQKINKAWVNDTQSSCKTGLPIKFFDNSNKEKQGFLTKYYGIISDNAPMEPCTKESRFTLPSSTLLRIKNKVEKIPQKSNPSLFFNSINYDFFDCYRELTENGSFIFFRDFLILLVTVFIIAILFGKKRCLILLKTLFGRILAKKIEFGFEGEYQFENYAEKFNDIDNKMIDIKLELEKVLLTYSEKKNEKQITKEINNVYLDLLDSDSLKIKDLENILQKKNVILEKNNSKTTLKSILYEKIRADNLAEV